MPDQIQNQIQPLLSKSDSNLGLNNNCKTLTPTASQKGPPLAGGTFSEPSIKNQNALVTPMSTMDMSTQSGNSGKTTCSSLNSGSGNSGTGQSKSLVLMDLSEETQVNLSGTGPVVTASDQLRTNDDSTVNYQTTANNNNIDSDSSLSDNLNSQSSNTNSNNSSNQPSSIQNSSTTVGAPGPSAPVKTANRGRSTGRRQGPVNNSGHGKRNEVDLALQKKDHSSNSISGTGVSSRTNGFKSHIPFRQSSLGSASDKTTNSIYSLNSNARSESLSTVTNGPGNSSNSNSNYHYTLKYNLESPTGVTYNHQQHSSNQNLNNNNLNISGSLNSGTGTLNSSLSNSNSSNLLNSNQAQQNQEQRKIRNQQISHLTSITDEISDECVLSFEDAKNHYRDRPELFCAPGALAPAQYCGIMSRNDREGGSRGGQGGTMNSSSSSSNNYISERNNYSNIGNSMSNNYGININSYNYNNWSNSQGNSNYNNIAGRISSRCSSLSSCTESRNRGNRVAGLGCGSSNSNNILDLSHPAGGPGRTNTKSDQGPATGLSQGFGTLSNQGQSLSQNNQGANNLNSNLSSQTQAQQPFSNSLSSNVECAGGGGAGNLSIQYDNTATVHSDSIILVDHQNCLNNFNQNNIRQNDSLSDSFFNGQDRSSKSKQNGSGANGPNNDVNDNLSLSDVMWEHALRYRRMSDELNDEIMSRDSMLKTERDDIISNRDNFQNLNNDGTATVTSLVNSLSGTTTNVNNNLESPGQGNNRSSSDNNNENYNQGTGPGTIRLTKQNIERILENGNMYLGGLLRRPSDGVISRISEEKLMSFSRISEEDQDQEQDHDHEIYHNCDRIMNLEGPGKNSMDTVNAAKSRVLFPKLFASEWDVSNGAAAVQSDDITNSKDQEQNLNDIDGPVNHNATVNIDSNINNLGQQNGTVGSISNDDHIMKDFKQGQNQMNFKDSSSDIINDNSLKNLPVFGPKQVNNGDNDEEFSNPDETFGYNPSVSSNNSTKLYNLAHNNYVNLMQQAQQLQGTPNLNGSDLILRNSNQNQDNNNYTLSSSSRLNNKNQSSQGVFQSSKSNNTIHNNNQQNQVSSIQQRVMQNEIYNLRTLNNRLQEKANRADVEITMLRSRMDERELKKDQEISMLRHRMDDLEQLLRVGISNGQLQFNQSKENGNSTPSESQDKLLNNILNNDKARGTGSSSASDDHLESSRNDQTEQESCNSNLNQKTNSLSNYSCSQGYQRRLSDSSWPRNSTKAQSYCSGSPIISRMISSSSKSDSAATISPKSSFNLKIQNYSSYSNNSTQYNYHAKTQTKTYLNTVDEVNSKDHCSSTLSCGSESQSNIDNNYRSSGSGGPGQGQPESEPGMRLSNYYDVQSAGGHGSGTDPYQITQPTESDVPNVAEKGTIGSNSNVNVASELEKGPGVIMGQIDSDSDAE